MNPKDTSKLVARFVIGQVAPKEIVEWAIGCMQRGVDSPTLSIVAGYTEAELLRDIQSFREDVTKVFKEFGVIFPTALVHSFYELFPDDAKVQAIKF